MDEIEINSSIPDELVIPECNKQLHKIGLKLDKTNYMDIKRNRFCTPFVCHLMVNAFMWRSILVLLIPREHRDLQVYYGNFGYLLGLSYHFNLTHMTWGLYHIFIMLIFHYNYIHDIKPTFLLLFQM